MQEEDTCRICSAPAEPEQPLFHPCKCSGTIRYIHQECLTTWLAHSRKKSCDVCKHPYSFKRVYMSNMPSRLPITLLVRRAIQHGLYAVLFGIRAVLVSIIWLAVLPWVTVWTWRMYFTMGESTAWYISDQERPAHLPEPPSNLFYTNLTSTANDEQRFIPRVLTHPVWIALSADIFTGQIIVCLIVLTVIAVFLLREWVAQNARPGVFNDEEEVPPVPVPVIAQPEPVPQPAPAPIVPAEVVRPPSPEEMPGLEPVSSEEEDDKGKGKERAHETRGTVSDSEVGRLRHRRRRLNDTSSSDEGGPIPIRRSRRRTRTGVAPSLASSSPLPSPVAEDFKFTFRAQRPLLPSTAPSTPGEPLASPNLATYRAPEFEAGPSRLGYFASLGEEASSLDKVAAPRKWSEGLGPDISEEEDVPTLPSEAKVGALPTRTRLADLGLDTSEAMPIGSRHLLSDFDPVPEVDAEEDQNAEGAEEENVAEYNRFFADVPVEEEQEDTSEDDYDEDHFQEAEDLGIDEDGLDLDDDFEFAGEDDEEGWEDEPEEPANEQHDHAPVPPAPGPEIPPDPDGLGEDDFDGAMEAIGMRGPVWGVLQNAALMIFVLDTAIGLGVWIPFTIGKSTALLSLNPRRALQLMHAPIYVVRFITDPVVDSTAYLVQLYVVPHLVSLYTDIVGPPAPTPVSTPSPSLISRLTPLWTNLQDKFAQLLIAPPDAPLPPNASYLDEVVRVAEPHFAELGKHVRARGVQVQQTWTRLALGQGPVERIFAVCLGYGAVAVCLAIYLNILTMSNVKSAGRAVRGAVRQQLLVLKVAMFIVIELVMFPLICGIVLDLCTVLLFPETNVVARSMFFLYSPLSAIFYHWIAGTVFMYGFALVLSAARTIMRPGAMWFIKDPQDTNTHPIRDIIDRSAFTQLAKISMSAVMYAIVVVFTITSIAGLMFFGSKSILPFRWRTREPLSSVPIDLIFLHLTLPYTMHYFRPLNATLKMVRVGWKVLAGQLRMTSYMFGVDAEDERYQQHITFARAFPYIAVQLDRTKIDGQFRRVPSVDHIPLPREMRVTAQVNEKGEPMDDVSRAAMAAQDAEIKEAGKTPAEVYKVVHIPSRFRMRLAMFIVELWVVGAGCVGLAIAIPILLGRQFFRLFLEREVHDGYSLIAAYYLLWACWLVGRSVERLDKRRQRTGFDGPRSAIAMFALKRGLVWLAKTFVMVLLFGIVLPTLMSLVADLYIILPIRYLLDPSSTHRLRVVDSWAMGLLYMKIGVFIHRAQAPAPEPHDIVVGVKRIAQNGWMHSDPVSAFKDVFLPVVIGLVGMILAPTTLFGILRYFGLLPIKDIHFVMYVYPTLFVAVGLGQGWAGFWAILSRWAANIRDAEYVQEVQLANHEPVKSRTHVET